MIISESQLREMIREELLKEGIISESDLLEEGIMDSLKKAAKTLVLSTSLMSGLAACGASQQQARNTIEQMRADIHGRAAQRDAARARRRQRPDFRGREETTTLVSSSTQRADFYEEALRIKGDEELLELMTLAFKNTRLRLKPETSQEILEEDRQKARALIIRQVDSSTMFHDIEKVREMGRKLYGFARHKAGSR